jgi:hypothetical protein
VRLLLDLGRARLERGSVEQPGERVEHGPVPVLELAPHERGGDTDDVRDHYQRRDHRDRVVEGAGRVDGEADSHDQQRGHAGQPDADREPEAQGRHGGDEREPGEHRARRPAGADRGHHEHEQHREQRAEGHQLRAVGALHPAVHRHEMQAGRDEQQDRPPAVPGGAHQHAGADRACNHEPCLPDALAGFHDPHTVGRRRAEPCPKQVHTS